MLLPAIAVGLTLTSTPAPHDLVQISELLADNDGFHLDEDGDDSDWIEVCNTGGASIDLAGWTLTDDAANLSKWTFPAHVLASGARLVVFASDKDRAVAGGELHTNFKLSSSGEFLALLKPDLTVSSAYAPSFPTQTSNISYGLRDSVPDEGYFDTPTPGAPNGDLFIALAPVEFSKRRGLKDTSFNLTLSHAEPGVTILVTTNGADPTTGAPYTAPLPVTDTTIVRAVATKVGHQDSPHVTHSYIFPLDVLGQSHAGAIADGFHTEWVEDDGSDWTLGGTRPGAWYGFDTLVLGAYTTAELVAALEALPTVSLSMSEVDWFGDGSIGETSGIYCNSTDYGDAWERANSAEWIDPQGGPEFQVHCGIAVQGGASTNATQRNQLSLSLKFKAEYGPKKLKFSPFDGTSVKEYDYLLLDAGSQLAPNSNAAANQKLHAQGLRDQFMSDVQNQMGRLGPSGTYVHLYLNGLYWGVYNLHERIDDEQAAAHQGGEAEEYDWVREGQVISGNDNPWDDSLPGRWDTAVEIAKNGLKPGDTWQGQSAYEQFVAIFDVADYAEYLMLNYYGGNTDWPQNNWMATCHARNSADIGDVNPEGRWRYHSWDAETVLYWGGIEWIVGDGFYDRTSITHTWEASAVYFYTYLRQNPEWRMLFADRAHHHLFHGSLFVDPDYATVGTPYDPAHPERNVPASLYHERAKLVETAIAFEYARWGNYWEAPGTYTPADWEVERVRLLEDYFPIRSGVLLAQLRNVVPHLYPLLDAPVISPYGGHIKPNETVALTVPPGSTVYYTLDGQDPRLEGGAVNPNAGVYAGPFSLPGPTTTVMARAYDGLEWSALERAGFAVGVRLRLNELVARNEAGALDETGTPEDWVELVNTGSSLIDLEGWGLTDDPARPGRWRFPAGALLPGKSRLVVFCDDDPLDGPYHATFQLAWKGEVVLLTGPEEDGDVMVDQIDFPRMRTDISYARIPDGVGEWRHSALPTPGMRNRLGDFHYK